MAGTFTDGTGVDLHYRGTTDGGVPANGVFVQGDWVATPTGFLFCLTGGPAALATWCDLSEIPSTGIISDVAYDATTWNGVTGVAPSKNSVRDKIEALSAATVPRLGGTVSPPAAIPHFNVKDFAPSGPGNNWTAAVQAAIDYVTALTDGGQAIGGIVDFQGLFVLDPIVMKDRVILNGGRGMAQGYRNGPARILASAAVPDDGFVFGAPGAVDQCGIVGFSAYGAGAASKTGFINLSNVTNSIFSGLYADNWGIEAAILGGGNNRLLHSQLAGLLNRAYIAAQRGSLLLTGSDWQVSHCEFTGSSSVAVSSGSLFCAAAVVNANSCEFDACVFQVADIGLVRTGGSYNRFSGCRFDTNAGHGLLYTGGTDDSFDAACKWNRNSNATANTYDHINVPSGGGSRNVFTTPGFNNGAQAVRYCISDAKNSTTFFNTYLNPQGDAGTTGFSSVVNSKVVSAAPIGDGLYGETLTSGIANMHRRSVAADTAVFASGDMQGTIFRASKSMTVANLRMRTGATAAAATPTLCKMGLFSVDEVTGDLTLIGVTANDTTLFAAANTTYTRALVASVAITAGQLLATVELVVTAAARPSFIGGQTNVAAAWLYGTESPMLSFVSNSAQADIVSITFANIGINNRRFYAELLP